MLGPNYGITITQQAPDPEFDPHTTQARGGINAALGTMDREDSWMMHAADTLREEALLADYERVETLCKSAPDAINELVGVLGFIEFGQE